MKVKLTEAQVKATWQGRLQIAQNQGQGVALRLNSGGLLQCPFIKNCQKAAGKLYLVQLAPPGTSDLVLITGAVWIETKRTGGKQNPNQIAFEELVTSMGMPYLCPDTTDTSSLEALLT